MLIEFVPQVISILCKEWPLSHTGAWDLKPQPQGAERGGIGTAPLCWVLRELEVSAWPSVCFQILACLGLKSALLFTLFSYDKCFCSSCRCSCLGLALSSRGFILMVKWVRKTVIKCSLSCWFLCPAVLTVGCVVFCYVCLQTNTSLDVFISNSAAPHHLRLRFFHFNCIRGMRHLCCHFSWYSL